MRVLGALLTALSLSAQPPAQTPDWKTIDAEALKTLQIADGKIWGRGAMDMKGQGVAQLYAFIMLARQKVALDRDVLLMAVADEEIGGGLGAACVPNRSLRRW